jgi:hypothetical protein
VSGVAPVSVPADSALVVVEVPVGAAVSTDKNRTLADGTVIDYNNAENPLPAPRSLPDSDDARPRKDASRAVKAPRASVTIDGKPDDWSGLKGDRVALTTGGRSPMKVDLQFAWDETNLYLLVREASADTTRTEAVDGPGYVKRFWDFDGLGLYLDLANRNQAEDLKDLNLLFGFSSSARTDLLCVRSHREPAWEELCMPATRVSTAGRPGEPRTVEAAVAWADMARLVASHRQPPGGVVAGAKPGYRFGCEPLLLDDGWRAQAFLNGSSNNMPRGDDPASVDIVLAAPDAAAN